MRELHLFAGAGGGILGGILLGHTCVCAVEIEPYCRKVLLQRQRDGILPRFPIWEDVRNFDGKPWRGKVDVVCGGFPCQDISIAGKGAGIEGERSGLWSDMSRVVCEAEPRFVFVENSPALAFRGLGRVLKDLAGLGYDAKWGVFHGGMFKCPQRRARIFILASRKKLQRDGSEYQREPCEAVSRKPERMVVAGGIPSNINGQGGEGLEPSSDASIAGQWNWRGKEDLQQIFNSPTESSTWPKPLLCRMDDGLAKRIHRLKAAGNGQIPLMAALAWETLSK